MYTKSTTEWIEYLTQLAADTVMQRDLFSALAMHLNGLEAKIAGLEQGRACEKAENVNLHRMIGLIQKVQVVEWAPDNIIIFTHPEVPPHYWNGKEMVKINLSTNKGDTVLVKPINQ